jgi:phage terminase large subunit-like protein
MSSRVDWDTSCPDWEQRLIAGESIVPCGPLFPERANEAMRIFKSLRVVDVARSPRMGEICRPWTLDYAATLFGAYDEKSGRQLIRYSMLLVAKKNIKSTLAAAIMVTALCVNWRKSAEFIILAPTVEVANNSFGPAKDMIHADEKLDAIMHVQPHFRMITHRNTGATLKVIAAENEAVSGKKASGVFFDELWLFGKRANADSMLREAIGGLASRPEGFVIYASTQSDQPPAGVFLDKLIEFRDIRDGKVIDKRSLPMLFEFPRRMLENGDYRKPENFYITNPNLGASVDEEFLLDEWAKAERKGEAQFRAFAAKHLNVEIGIALRSDGWAGAEYWTRGIDASVSFDSVLERSECVTIGIDGGGLDDLLGVAIIGREKLTKRWLVWTHAFISPEGMERRKINETLYKGFIEDGDLTLVDQLPDDLAGVVEIVQRVKEAGLLSCVGVDAIGIGGIVDAMDSIDVTEESGLLRSVRQGISLMGAIKTVERKLADGSLRHGNQRMMSWCVGNVKVIFTPTAMRLARDETGAGKIDPLAAILDAAELMMANPGVKNKEMQLMFFGPSKKKELHPTIA